MYDKVNDVAMAPDPLLLRVLTDAFSLQMLTEQTVELVVRTVVVPGVESNIMLDIIVFEDVVKKLPLLGPSMATRAIKSRQLRKSKQCLQYLFAIGVDEFDTGSKEGLMIGSGLDIGRKVDLRGRRLELFS